MAGPLLRTGRLSEYKALGTVGNPVFSAAPQLRSAIKRQIGSEAADMLAVPQINEAGDKVDWYSPVEGPVVPWSSASPEEQAQVSGSIRSLRSLLDNHGAQLLSQSSGGESPEIFARLLPLAGKAPDSSHVYLVGGKPVVTFWGFEPLNAPPGWDGLSNLVPAPAVPAVAGTVPTVTPVAIAEGFDWWRWLRWLLLLLLLLLLLWWLLGLRGCDAARTDLGLGTPAPKLTPSGPDVPAVYAPNITAPTVAVPGVGVPAVGLPTGIVPSVGIPGVGGPAVGLPSGVAPSVAGGGAGGPGLAAPGLGESGPGGPGQGVPAVDLPPEGGTPPPVPETESGVPPIPEIPNDTKLDQAPQEQPLAISPEAVASGNTDFLNGHWRSQVGLVDSETGKPIEVEYDFNNGQGTSTIRRADGTPCTAPTTAAMVDGKLVIDQTGDAVCPDGTSFHRSKVECTPGSDGGEAQCRGLHAEGGDYNVQIIK